MGSPDGNEGLPRAWLFLLDDDLDAAVFGAVGVGAVGDEGLVGAVALGNEAFGYFSLASAVTSYLLIVVQQGFDTTAVR